MGNKIKRLGTKICGDINTFEGPCAWLQWDVSIRMDLKEICINTRNWVDSVQDRHYWRTPVIAALNLRFA